MQRTGTVDEVRQTVSPSFLAGAAYITRQVIAVNGGLFDAPRGYTGMSGLQRSAPMSQIGAGCVRARMPFAISPNGMLHRARNQARCTDR